MGLGEALAAVGAKIGDGSRYCRADGTVVGPIVTTNSTGWNGMYGMHRADLLNTLAAKLPPTTIRLGQCCTGIVQTASFARLQFAHGDSIEVDIVISADGIQSTLQKYVVEQTSRVFRRSRLSRFDFPRETAGLAGGSPHGLDGGRKALYRLPGSERSTSELRRLCSHQNETVESWSAAGDVKELAVSFDGWDSQIVRLLETVEGCYWWGLYDRRPLASWTSGRLVLLGDAATRCSHLGQGANQAIEDGVALAVFLEGRDRTKSRIFCSNMNNFAAPEPTPFKLRRGKPGFVLTQSTTTWSSAIAKSQTRGVSQIAL